MTVPIFNDDISAQFDGVNTTITLPNNIYAISDLTIGGSQYFDFTFTIGTKTIELDDAFAAGYEGRIDYYPSAPTGIGTGLTVLQCRERLERHFDDTLGDVSDELFLDWLNDLNNYMYDILMNINIRKYVSSYDITTVAGTDAYALPTDFRTIKIYECGLYKDGTNKELELTGYLSNCSGYYIQDSTGQIIFTPTPTTAETYKLRYIPILADLEEDTDKILLDRRNFQAVLDYLDKNYGRWNIDLTRENNSDQRFARFLKTLYKNVITSPIIYTL